MTASHPQDAPVPPGHRRVTLSHTYAVDPDHLWRLTCDLDHLAQLNAPLVRMRDLPSGRLGSGQVIAVQVSLFGLLPWQPYRMEVLEVDDRARFFRSLETGNGVRAWRHFCQVTPTGDGGARLTDRIDIDAGAMTPLVAAWARRLYRHRDGRRRRLLLDHPAPLR